MFTSTYVLTGNRKFGTGIILTFTAEGEASDTAIPFGTGTVQVHTTLEDAKNVQNGGKYTLTFAPVKG